MEPCFGGAFVATEFQTVTLRDEKLQQLGAHHLSKTFSKIEAELISLIARPTAIHKRGPTFSSSSPDDLYNHARERLFQVPARSQLRNAGHSSSMRTSSHTKTIAEQV